MGASMGGVRKRVPWRGSRWPGFGGGETLLWRIGCSSGEVLVKRVLGEFERMTPLIGAHLYPHTNRCKAVSYCGTACQKADWKSHKSECEKEAAKNKNEEI